MQITRQYSGALASFGSAVSRIRSWGTTTTVSAYPAKVDFVNQTIADFLSNDCGVNAAYEARTGDAYKFLYIYDVPFFFSFTTTSAYGLLYAPNDKVYGTSSGNGWTLFNSTTTTYGFSLNFVGDPENGFVLRVKPYGSTSFSSVQFKFLPTTNLLNNRKGILYNNGSMGASTNLSGYLMGIDIDENGHPVDITGQSTLGYLINLYPQTFDKTEAPGKFPLVPFIAGVRKTNGIYMHPANFNLPAAQEYKVEAQTEIEISGRRFIVTTSDTPSSSYLNMGLIEVTNNP